MSEAITHFAKGGPFPATNTWYGSKREGGLARFAIAITVLNLAGHLYLGFEQSWITPFVSLSAAYLTEFVGEYADALAKGRSLRLGRSVKQTIIFFLPAHITGLAVSMLLYAGEQLWTIAFASAVAIASKYLLRVNVGEVTRDGKNVYRHFLNPSNFGITCTLILFPLTGVAPPYQFSEEIWGWVDWLLPCIIIFTGSYLNVKATGRMPLILAWLVAFATQACIRSFMNSTPYFAGLFPMTGFSFLLFTFYMITDPATSPTKTTTQIAFATSVAAIYGLLMEFHCVFGLFYSLTIVTGLRGVWLFGRDRLSRWIPRRVTEVEPKAVVQAT